MPAGRCLRLTFSCPHPARNRRHGSRWLCRSHRRALVDALAAAAPPRPVTGDFGQDVDMNASRAGNGQSASELISQRIAELGDWRGETLSQDAQAHQGGRPGRRRGVEVDGHSRVVARRHHLHRRVLQEGREADVRQGRVARRIRPGSSTRASTATSAARSTSTRAKRSTRPPSRRSCAKRSPSTAPVRRRLRRSRSRGFRQPQADQPTESHNHVGGGDCDGTIPGDVPGLPVSQSRRSGGSPMSSIRWGSSGGTRTTSPERTIRI